MSKARSFLFPFKYSHKVAFVVEFSHKKIRLYAKGKLLNVMGLKENGNGMVTIKSSDKGSVNFMNSEVVADDKLAVDWLAERISDDVPVLEIESPYAYSDLWDDDELCCRIQTIQHSDVLYIFNERFPVKVLKRYSNTDWRLEDLELKNGPFLAMNTKDILISSSELKGKTTLTAAEDVFVKTDEGRLMRFSLDNDNTTIWASSISVSVGKICYSDNKYYKAINEGTTGVEKPTHTQGVKSDGGVRWEYLHDGSGVVKITEFVDAKHVGAEIFNQLPSGMTDGTLYWEMGAFHAGASYPKAGAFFRNRLALLANTETGPNVYFSMNGDYNNFADNECREATAECAITVPVINTEFNEGKWLYAGDVLFVGTGDAEFYIDVVSSGQAMAADNVKISQISSVGSKAVRPVGVGAHILFTDRYGLSLRDLAYNYSYDGYDPIDISLLGKHLFQARIVGLAYQEIPDKILWCLMGDGSLTALTFSAEQEVAALSRHDFSGKVESLAVIPNLEDCRDEVWLEVKRKIGNKLVRTVEYMESGMPRAVLEDLTVENTISENEKRQNEYVLKEAMYLDCAYVYEKGAFDNGDAVLGLDYLEGAEVAVFADGVVCPRQVVKYGKVEISPKYNKVLIGLPICSQYVPQSMYLSTENGSGLGQKQRINHVLLAMYLSGGGKIGESEETLREIFYRRVDAEMNVPQELFSGNKEVLFDGSTPVHEKAAKILIENDSPLPMNILALVPSIDVEQ